MSDLRANSYSQDSSTVFTGSEYVFSPGVLLLGKPIAGVLFIVTTVLWAVLLISPLPIRWMGWDIYTVRGASMEPTISPGSLALTRALPTEDLGTGEIIVFPAPWAQVDGEPKLIIHRLVQLVPTGEGLQGFTEGDGNGGVLDPAPILLGVQVPVVMTTVPLLGNVYAFVHGWGLSITLVVSLSILGMSAAARAYNRRRYSSAKSPWPARSFFRVPV